MKTEDQLTKSIMRKVYIVWFLRKATTPFMMKLYVMAAFVWQSLNYVSVKNVFVNSPSLSDVGGIVQFYMSAFLETEAIVQVLFVGTLVVAVWWLVKDVTFGHKEVHA